MNFARIMIVDDEATNIEVLQRLLRHAGYGNVVAVERAAEAVPRFVASAPDIVLLDLHLGADSGLDVLRGIQAHVDEDDFVPVIVLTGDNTAEAKRQALAQGAKDYITKPFEVAEVILRIRNHLETRRLHCRLREENGRLDMRVRERTGELEETRLEMLERLSLAGEFRDDDTGQHGRRVGERSATLALACGLSQQEADVIRRAAPLHDIGKIGIPDNILLKPGRLSDEELMVMRGHTEIGAQILAGSGSSVLRCAETVALHHHERYDGAGYPHQLHGEDIPLAARIVALVDFFDALSSDRPYRRAWSREDVIAEIRRERGRHFDPFIVDRFLELLAREEEQRREPTGRALRGRDDEVVAAA